MKSRVALVGDSDIAYWPPELHPVVDGSPKTIVSGHSGATLGDILPHLRTVIKEHGGKQELLIVACAGENDIGNNISLDNSVRSLDNFIDIIFDDSNDQHSHRLVFLGPKFEPWLEDDPSYKKKYSGMSRSFERCCQRHANSENIHYIDCLTMFCGDTATVPGAVHGGRAKADYKYFAADQLHLSNHGYKIWKEVVESQIKESTLKAS
jgi:lysophospholipase L1-like esterase